jgi:ABC-2 type transport system permease protein
MRLISQEKAQGTIELLLTMPVRDVEVVVGKYLAAMTLFASMLSFTLVSVLILLWTSVNKVQFLFLKVGHVDVGPLIAGYVGFLLIGGGYMAIGMFASSLTGNQILAAFVGFAMVLVVLVAGSIADVFQPPISDFLTFIGSNQHVSNFGNGLISVPDVVYALTMIVVPLWFTVVVLGARRWH